MPGLEQSLSYPEGFSYILEFLSLHEHDRCVEHIRALSFMHDSFRGQQLKRSYAQFGFAYASTGRKLVATEPFPDWLHALATKAVAHCPDHVIFNQAIITHYPPTAGIGWHTDAPRFADCIVGLSFVGMGVFQFRPNGTQGVSHELRVAPGSLYVMTGAARHEFQHQIKPVKNDRYSLTLRTVPNAAEEE